MLKFKNLLIKVNISMQIKYVCFISYPHWRKSFDKSVDVTKNALDEEVGFFLSETVYQDKFTIREKKKVLIE